MNRKLIPLLAAMIMSLGACAGSPVAAPIEQNTVAPAALPNQVPAPAKSAEAKAPAPAPPAKTDSASVAAYMKLVGHNVPRQLAVTLTAPASNLNHSFTIGQPCTVGYGGTITAKQTVGQTVTAVYEFPFPTRQGECPNGAQFQMPKSTLDTFRALTAAVDQQFQEQLGYMSKIEVPPGPLPSVEFPILPIVRVMNATVLHSADRAFGFWSTCFIGDDNAKNPSGKLGKVSTISLNGQDDTLVLYTTDKVRSGNNECPNNTMFVLEDFQPNNPQLLGYAETLGLS